MGDPSDHPLRRYVLPTPNEVLNPAYALVMGYLADDLKHECKVASKVLKPQSAAAVCAEPLPAGIRTTAESGKAPSRSAGTFPSWQGARSSS